MKKVRLAVAIFFVFALTLSFFPAENWAAAAGQVRAPLSITSVKANKTTAYAGDTITWTTAAAGGSGTKSYSFILYKNNKQIYKREYTSSNKYSYVPTGAGTYKVRAYVKDATSTVALNSGNVTVRTPLPVSLASINPNVTSASVDDTIKWTATAKDGSGSKKYMFILYRNNVQIEKTVYDTSRYFSFTPVEAGTYKVRAYVKDYTGTSSKTSREVDVAGPPPLSITSVKANRTSASAGNTITWTTTAAGGSGARKYSFILYKNNVQVTKTDYSTSRQYSFVPKEGGTYKVRAYVKDDTGTVAMNSGTVAVAGPPPLKVISVKSSVASAYECGSITWTTTAEGGYGTKAYMFILYKNGVQIDKTSYSTSSRSYTLAGAESGTYKVRAYVKDDTGTVALNSADVKVTAMPEMSVYILGDTIEDTPAYAFQVTNLGTKPLVIKGPIFSEDSDYSSLDREWQLTDLYGNSISSLTIEPGASGIVCMVTKTDSTWVDQYTTYYVPFRYDGVNYVLACSAYYGEEIFLD